MTSEQLFKMVKELDNAERWKFLELMYDEYYSKRNNSSKMEELVSNLQKDVEFLSRKIGVHDMHLSRLLKEDDE